MSDWSSDVCSSDLLPDQACFGWRIRLAEAPPVVRVREVLKLPEAPAFWSGEDDPYSTHVFSDDRTTATTEEYKAPEEGWISSDWCIAEGDPLGAHCIEVLNEDVLARQHGRAACRESVCQSG